LGIIWNKQVDTLAKAAVMGIPTVGLSIAWRCKSAKRKLLEGWHAEWSAKVVASKPNHLCLQALTDPPSTKPVLLKGLTRGLDKVVQAEKSKSYPLVSLTNGRCRHLLGLDSKGNPWTLSKQAFLKRDLVSQFFCVLTSNVGHVTHHMIICPPGLRNLVM
jgi:hypothetical protein